MHVSHKNTVPIDGVVFQGLAGDVDLDLALPDAVSISAFRPRNGAMRKFVGGTRYAISSLIYTYLATRQYASVHRTSNEMDLL